MIFASMDGPPLTEEELLREGVLSSSKAGEQLSDLDIIASLHDNPMLLPEEHIRTNVYPMTIIVAVALTVSQQIIYFYLKSQRTKKKKPSSPNEEEESAEKLKQRTVKESYQFTNLLMNLALGLTGFYHYFFTVSSTATVAERISGYDHVYIFGSMQMGYQIWSLPMGLFVVNETTAMLFHHVAVCGVSSLSGLTTNGFRYFTPFFFGLIEISSVPLAIMNNFKDNPTRIERNPGLYTAIRLVFAIVFLTVRVILWLPQMYDVLKLMGMLCYTCDNVQCRVSVGSFWFFAFFLTLLQVMWGWKVLQGLIKGIMGKGGKNKKKKVGEDTKQE